jgi:hypothetical protein
MARMPASAATIYLLRTRSLGMGLRIAEKLLRSAWNMRPHFYSMMKGSLVHAFRVKGAIPRADEKKVISLYIQDAASFRKVARFQ